MRSSELFEIEEDSNEATFDAHELFIIITIIVFASSFTSTSVLEAKQSNWEAHVPRKLVILAGTESWEGRREKGETKTKPSRPIMALQLFSYFSKQTYYFYREIWNSLIIQQE